MALARIFLEEGTSIENNASIFFRKFKVKQLKNSLDCPLRKFWGVFFVLMTDVEGTSHYGRS